ncbi:MAG: class I SAM-dependent methyltransferase [Acidobacteria bacterium]|nr:class I SAM-dependent methyltransferase [Acidobacteriota bacterium]
MNSGQELTFKYERGPAEEQAPVALSLECPVCRSPLGSGVKEVVCNTCRFAILESGGIYRALPPNREQYFRRFIADYEFVREKEGRGSDSAAYYLSLPFEDVTGSNSWQWKIRARTFIFLTRKVLPRIRAEHPDGASILDIGAGNCWLCYRLAAAGDRPVALDIIDNPSDGLGAARHYPGSRPFPRFQAEMDRLPFEDRQFDAVIFNASFHYSTDYEVTLEEALRCLKRPGYLVITDSPCYQRPEAGERMVQEKHASFRRTFGLASDSLRSMEYLTPQILARLANRLSIEWEVGKPWYGVSWALRPFKAFVLGKRETSKFYVFWARVKS